MKKTSLLFLAGFVGALVLGQSTAQAQWTYFDVIDGVQHPSSANPNTFNASTGSPTDWVVTGDTTPEWRYRNTGPGPKAWDGNAYQGRFSEGDVPIYTVLTGLTPLTDYFVRVYGVFPQTATNAISNRARWGAEFSLDSGTTWEHVDTSDDVLGRLVWVDNSTDLGTPLEGPNGDTRFYVVLMNKVTSDASGNVRIDVRLPELLSDGRVQDRFVLDGYALAVPEPTSLSLLTLGGLLALGLRRRDA